MLKKCIRIAFPIIVPFLLSILLLSMGCATDRGAVQQKEVSPVSLSEEGVTIVISLLNENQLLERFGEKNNPFIPPPSAIGLNRVMVFELYVETTSEAEIILNRLELQSGGKPKSPKNIFHFSNYWELELKPGDTRKYDLGRIKLAIKRNLLPNKFTVNKDSNSTGFFVFQGRLPRYGEFTLFVPVFKKNGEMIHNFRYDFTL